MESNILKTKPADDPLAQVEQFSPIHISENKNYFYQIIITLIFVATLSAGIFFFVQSQSLKKQLALTSIPVNTPTTTSPSPVAIINPSPTAIQIKLLNTSDWSSHSCGQIFYKIPQKYIQKCIENDDGTKDVLIEEKVAYGKVANIMIRNYDGGSRRQYWITTLMATESEVDKYMRFQESIFGSVYGLDVFGSSGWWQGGYSSPILIANGKTIVQIYGGRNFDDQTGKITRWDMTDTIASTIKFTN